MGEAPSLFHLFRHVHFLDLFECLLIEYEDFALAVGHHVDVTIEQGAALTEEPFGEIL
jgi:hypothetical protein